MAEQKFVSKENLGAIWAGIKAYVEAQKHLPDGGTNGQILQRTTTGYGWTDNITLDDSLANTDNPVKNKAINAAITALQGQVNALKNYDDNEVRGLIDDLEKAIEDLHNYDDTALKNDINSIKSSITNLTTKDGELAAKDTELSESIAAVNTRLDTLLNTENANGVIDTFKEIESFLKGVTDSSTLTGLLASMETSIKNELNGNIDKKIDMPTGGTAGQILTKTTSGVEWSTITLPEVDEAYTDAEILSIFTS